MPHRIDIYLPDDMWKELRKHTGTTSQKIRDALTQYLHNENQTNMNYNYELVDVLKNEIEYLRNDKAFLQNQLSAMMIVKQPLLERVIMKLKGKTAN